MLQIETEEEVFDTASAVSYLLSKHVGLSKETLKDTFYHKIDRGQVPCEHIPHGKVHRLRFKRSDLDNVTFRQTKETHTPRRAKVTAADWGLDVPNEVWLEFIPREVHTAADLAVLESMFGPLVDGMGLIEELHRRYHVWYSTGAIKRRRYRGSILYVGYSGAKRRTYWYPVKQLDVLHFQPANTKKAIPELGQN